MIKFWRLYLLIISCGIYLLYNLYIHCFLLMLQGRSLWCLLIIIVHLCVHQKWCYLEVFLFQQVRLQAKLHLDHKFIYFHQRQYAICIGLFWVGDSKKNDTYVSFCLKVCSVYQIIQWYLRTPQYLYCRVSNDQTHYQPIIYTRISLGL